MLSPAALAERDGPSCWLCGNDVDPRAPRGSAHAGSVDHVVPRAKGGRDDGGNLRLAHRQCNSRRGSALPELDWPVDVPVVEHAPIWSAVQRAARRPGEWEVVGIVVGADAAARARGWLDRTVPQVLGGTWEVGDRTVGPGLTALSLRQDAGATGPRRRRGPGAPKSRLGRR